MICYSHSVAEDAENVAGCFYISLQQVRLGISGLGGTSPALRSWKVPGPGQQSSSGQGWETPLRQSRTWGLHRPSLDWSVPGYQLHTLEGNKPDRSVPRQRRFIFPGTGEKQIRGCSASCCHDAQPGANDIQRVALPLALAGANASPLLPSLRPFPSLPCRPLPRCCFGNVGTLLWETKQKPGCSMGLAWSLVCSSPILRFWAQFYLVILQTSPEQHLVLLCTSKGNETLHI